MSPLAVVKHLNVTHDTSFGLITIFELDIILTLLLHEEMGGGQGHSVVLTESKGKANAFTKRNCKVLDKNVTWVFSLHKSRLHHFPRKRSKN